MLIFELKENIEFMDDDVIRCLSRKIRGGVRKAVNRFIRPQIVNYLPFRISKKLARPEDFPVLLATSSKTLNKRIAFDKRLAVPSNKFIYDLDWEKVTVTVSDANMHPTVKELFVECKNYKDTKQFARMVAAVNAFESGEIKDPSREGAYWCRSANDVCKYFEILEECYHSIRDNGFLSQREIYEKSGKIGRGTSVRHLKDEVEVLINHKGELVFSSRRANHRFSIAKLLGVDYMPIKLSGISESYLSKNFDTHRINLQSLFNKVISGHANIGIYKGAQNGYNCPSER